MGTRTSLDTWFAIALGLAIVLAGLRSGQRRGDVMLFVIPIAVWILANLVLLSPLTGSPLVNSALLIGPLLVAFVFLAKRWKADPPASN